MNRVFAVATGLWLGATQVVLYYQLQAQCSSAVTTYLILLSGWLLGATVGVWLEARRLTPSLIAVTGLAPLAVDYLLAHYPYRVDLLGLYALLIALTALFAGHFFAAEKQNFNPVGQLFFWENNGFVVGLALGGLGVIYWGSRLALPVHLLGMLVLLALFGFKEVAGSGAEPASHVPG